MSAPYPPREPYAGPPPTGLYRQAPVPPPYYYAAATHPAPQDELRPSVVTAAAVLAWVCGGLLLIAAGLLFFGAAFLHGFDTVSGGDTGGYVVEFTTDGVIDVVAAGFLIAGGVGLANRSGVARLLTVAGSVIVLLETFYWLARWAGRSDGAIVGYAVIFALLGAVTIGLSYTSAAGAWLHGPRPAAPRPQPR